MTSRLRVAYFGTGHTGTQVLRQILQRQDPELVSHLVHSPEKVGKHSGAIAELGPAGVSAIADVDEFCALKADCVTYLPTEFRREVDEVIDHTGAAARVRRQERLGSAGLPKVAAGPTCWQTRKILR